MNRKNQLLEETHPLETEISTCFSWNARWHLVLPKYGDHLCLFDFKRKQSRKVKFQKLMSDSISAKVVPSESIDLNLGCMRIGEMVFIITNSGGVSVVDLEGEHFF
jgi:hypothetical protein